MAGYLEASHRVGVEMCLEGESAHLKKTNCKKDPGHRSFISLEDFQKYHLPAPFNTTQVWNYIKTAAELTVRISKKEGHSQFFGSGWVWRSDRQFSDGKPCPCNECKSSQFPKWQWTAFLVVTAAHVGKHDKNCQNTTVDLFYDNENVLASCPKLVGVRAEYWDEEADKCVLYCITHDGNLSRKMEDLIQTRIQKQEELNRQNRQRCTGRAQIDDLAVVVSHPHGCSKQISIGKIVKTPSNEMTFEYDASTCPGSSGGYVWSPCANEVWNQPSYVCAIHHTSGINTGSGEKNTSAGYGFWSNLCLQ